jgi:predicted transcriptional regulator
MKMKIEIDAPVRRSLNANERQVLTLLEAGKTIYEIAKIMRICVREDWSNINGVPSPSVKGIVTSIREKGWEIPGDRKDEEEMKKITQERAEAIAELRSKGYSSGAISKELGVPIATASRYAKKYDDAKKEPVTADTVTSPEEKPMNETSVNSIPQNFEAVKSEDVPEEVPQENVQAVEKLPIEIVEILTDKLDEMRERCNELARERSELMIRMELIERFVDSHGVEEY